MADRRATVILLQHGDPEISEAIAGGILEARAGRGNDLIRHGASAAPPSPKGEGFWEGKALTREQIEVVEAEIDRQHIVRALVRVAVGNDKTDEDYRHMTTRARGLYAEPVRRGPLRRAWDRIFTGYALICYAIGEAFDAQRHVLGGR